MIEIANTLASEVIKSTFDLLRKSLENRGQSTDKIVPSLENHISEIVSWSERVQFFGMAKAFDTDKFSIKINISSIPRKFRGNSTNNSVFNESNLFEDQHHYVILGSPGSGKTTALKRMTRTLLFSEPISQNDEFQFPILIRLRELSEGESLLKCISNLLGIPVKESELISGEKSRDLLIGNEKIIDALPKILNESKVVIFADGLDEISPTKRINIEKEISFLAHRLNKSKIILTCRSGDFVSHISGFNVIELCELTAEQISEFAFKWSDNANDFLTTLASLPYKDLGNRPLFLAQLVVLHNNYGYLPEQPSDVYRMIIRLLLEDWDFQRRIKRPSKYAGFTSEKKLDFLSALSYQITYKIQKKSFRNQQLIESYLKIYKRFNLPENQADKVVSEIESHTGLLLKAGFDLYEFSHLSLQEYLCAYYLVREPVIDNIYNYLYQYPAPLAISVTLSSDPSNCLANIILFNKKWDENIIKQISSLFDRIILEKTYFEESELLGIALVTVLSYYSKYYIENLLNSYFELLNFVSIKKSLSLGLKHFKINTSDKDAYFFNLKSLPNYQLLSQHEHKIPLELNVNSNIINKLLSELNMSIVTSPFPEEGARFEATA